MCLFPLQSSNRLTGDLSFFASLAPSLDWHPAAACYTHEVDFAGGGGGGGVVSTDSEADTMVLASDDEASAQSQSQSLLQQQARARARAASPMPFEAVLELSMQVESSDDEDEDDEEGPHGRPFSGVLKESCSMRDCIVTPITGGRFYHRCAARPHEPPYARGPSPPPAPTTATAAPQAAVACRGLLVWSLPGSLSLRIGGRPYAPSPFHRLGVWCARDDVEEARRSRLDWMQQQNEASMTLRQTCIKQLTSISDSLRMSD